MVPHQFINLNPCAQKEARAILYEVKINPFRKEFFISGIPQKLNLVLGTKLVILCGKELLLGTLKNQRLFFEDNYYETISEHYSKYSPHIHYEFIPSELSNNQDFCQIVRIATEDDLALRANLEREFP
ncbi:MAG: hypothetical protein NZ601_03235, partial [candidate division WOR-3 bacterium]|nr:hypothetical protein [candidate division WOR-3 bacterium]MDW7988392.1 hypothetical protein [candidate division WOR-3 bacterium]